MRIRASAFARGLLCLLFLTAGDHAVATEQMHRSLFYRETPFGSLAWIRGAKNRPDARDDLTVESFGNEGCTTLPAAGNQWFLLNHREPGLDGQPGYFSVRILYQTALQATGRRARQGLHVHRNENWYDGATRLSRDFEKRPTQVSMDERDFIALHEPSLNDEDSSLSVLEADLGGWHMAPEAGAETSWADRDLLGTQLRFNSRSTTSALSARLIRFTATSSTSTSDPLIFWLDPLGATSALILVDAPRHVYQGSRRVYEVQFGGDCL